MVEMESHSIIHHQRAICMFLSTKNSTRSLMMISVLISLKMLTISIEKTRLEEGAHRLLLLLLVATDFPLLPGDVASET